MQRRWHGYRRLTPGERRVARQSWAMLGAAALLLKFLRLHAVVVLLSRISAAPTRQVTDGETIGQAEQAAALFVTVANLHPLPTTCLPRAVALWWLLRGHGIDADIVLGVQPQQSAVTAHAWVEAAGRVLGDPQQVYRAYSTILARYPRRQ